jgi:superoxide dismutase, Fe-Mn family
MLEFIKLLEGKAKSTDLEIIPLNFTEREVSSVMSGDTLDLHYTKLAKGYAKRYNEKQGDPEFNYAGVFLHNLWFTQFRQVTLNNKPNGPIKGFIEKNYGSYDSFKDKFEEIAMTIQGSGWVYLAHDGSIKTIKNHEVKSDILLLVDWWEHAFILDYGSDKKAYLRNLWKIINWNVISTRLGKYWSK